MLHGVVGGAIPRIRYGLHKNNKKEKAHALVAIWGGKERKKKEIEQLCVVSGDACSLILHEP